MNLHDWIDELSDVLDLETEVDEALLNDLAGLARDNVEHSAGPVTAYLLGYAAGSTTAGPAAVERLATKASELAESWDRPASEEEDDLEDLDIPDDGSIADLSDTDDTGDDNRDDDGDDDK